MSDAARNRSRAVHQKAIRILRLLTPRSTIEDMNHITERWHLPMRYLSILPRLPYEDPLTRQPIPLQSPGILWICRYVSVCDNAPRNGSNDSILFQTPANHAEAYATGTVALVATLTFKERPARADGDQRMPRSSIDMISPVYNGKGSEELASAGSAGMHNARSASANSKPG